MNWWIACFIIFGPFYFAQLLMGSAHFFMGDVKTKKEFWSILIPYIPFGMCYDGFYCIKDSIKKIRELKDD
jgi:hypothetical protein